MDIHSLRVVNHTLDFNGNIIPKNLEPVNITISQEEVANKLYCTYTDILQAKLLNFLIFLPKIAFKWTLPHATIKIHESTIASTKRILVIDALLKYFDLRTTIELTFPNNPKKIISPPETFKRISPFHISLELTVVLFVLDITK